MVISGMTKFAKGKSMHTIFGLILLLFAPFIPSTFTRQSTPAAKPLTPAASQQTYAVKIEFNRRVRMRDGTELSADVYRPDASGPFPVILSRTPYTKTSGSTLSIVRYFVSRGFVFVTMDVRGRGDSDGTFVPYRNDGQDGYDAIEWCAVQEWSTGKVGTIGGSYNGCIQWLTAVQQPPHLAAMIALTSPSDPFTEWPTGQPCRWISVGITLRRAVSYKTWRLWTGTSSTGICRSSRWTKQWAVLTVLGKKRSSTPS
jgi:putative CocE/NonD family hydrolase